MSNKNMFDNDEYILFKMIASLTQEGLKNSMRLLLEKFYPTKKIKNSPYYICAEGNIPICLVAHLDTVYTTPVKDLYFDREEDVLWSPQGIGADDRAGVYAIISLLQEGFLPHIIFTTDEEKGCLGSSRLALEKSPFKTIKYIIQIDRRGSEDCVFYDCENKEFNKYIENFGFTTAFGTFTDITALCPAWGVAGVNLSSGYYNEHSLGEYLRSSELKQTIEKIKAMLSEDNIPFFKFQTSKTMYFDYYQDIDFLDPKNTKRLCGNCNCVEVIDLMLPVTQKDGTKKYYCGNCLSKHVLWCKECGEPYDPKTPISNNEVYGICPKCKKQNREVNKYDF